MKGKRLSKILVGFCLVLILALALPLASACAKPAPTPTPTPTAAPQEPILLRWTSHAGKVAAYNEAGTWVMREFEKRSGGRVTLEFYYAGTLASAKEALTAVRTGVADCGIVDHAHSPAELPLMMVATQPGIVMDTWSGVLATGELVEMPEIKAELDAKNLVYYGSNCLPNMHIISKKPIRTLDDFKGLMIGARGGEHALVAKFGASPLSIPSIEVYEALQRGTVDANINNPAWADTYNYWEVAKYWTKFPVGGSLQPQFMNKDTWNKLPADLQELLKGLQAEQAKAFYLLYEVSGDGVAWEKEILPNCEIIEPSSEDIAEFVRGAEEVVWNKWVEENSAKGLPAQKVLDKWLELNKKYQAQTHPSPDELSKYKIKWPMD